MEKGNGAVSLVSPETGEPYFVLDLFLLKIRCGLCGSFQLGLVWLFFEQSQTQTEA